MPDLSWGRRQARNKGDRLPLLPEHLFKAGLAWTPTDEILLGLDIQANSDQYLRGDEGNDNGTIAGYAVLNAYGSYAFTGSFRVFFNINNVFDSEFETFGLFGEASDVLGDEFGDSRFLSPGAPRGAWVGIEYSR